MQRRVKKIIDDIANDTGLPVLVIQAIIESQFQCAREATKEGEAGKPSTFKNIRFKHLGLLAVRPNKILKIHEQSQQSIQKSVET